MINKPQLTQAAKDGQEDTHIVQLRVPLSLLERLKAFSPRGTRYFAPDVVTMLESYCDLREEFGKDIFQGIYNHLTQGD